MAKQSVLIIEDEQSILELLKYNLEKEGYRVLCAERGDEGLELALSKTPELILLDLMLPEMNGLDICKTLRQNSKTQSVSIIILSAKGEETDKIIGLELGADDYITKPFSPREMLARVKAVLRRKESKVATDVVKIGKLQIDFGKHVLMLNGKKVNLTSKEFSLLRVLLEANGRVMSRERLLEIVWEYDQAMNIETRTVDMHIGQLRKKIKGESHRIVTVKNAGYRFDV